MEENKKSEDLMSEYLASIRKTPTNYPYLFEMAWMLYRNYGDKQKAFDIWTQIPDDKVTKLLEHLFDYIPSYVKKEDLHPFEDYLKSYINTSTISSCRPITVGEMKKMLSHYSNDTKIVLVRCVIPEGGDDLSYCHRIEIESIEGLDYEREKQVKGVAFHFSDYPF